MICALLLTQVVAIPAVDASFLVKTMNVRQEMLVTKPLVELSWTKTQVVGHRGAAAYEPENTVAAFKKAIEVGAQATECDVWMSKDGVPMILHDAMLDRTTKLKGRIEDFTAEELKAAGVPTLEEVCLITKGKIVFVIEIKGGKGVEAATVDVVRKHEMESQVIVFSFNDGIVERVKAIEPKLFTVWLNGFKTPIEQFETLPTKLKEIKADAIGFSYGNVTTGLAGFLRAQKVPLFVWTVPPGKEVDRLKELKVNFIITDHPADVLKQLGLSWS